MAEHKIILFQQKTIRRTFQEGQWWFSVVDIISAITDSSNPRRYWSDLKDKVSTQEGFVQLYEKIVQLKLVSRDGKKYETDCVNTETALRLIQSIPSPRAEPFKRWLATVGYERIQEIEDPERASQRARDMYKEKGYPSDWIEKRMRSIAIRDELTDEWKNRGVADQKDYAILTAEISKATFGMTPSQYKKFKGLKRENLRDHMNDLELIFSMLGEASTTEITRNTDAIGFDENKLAAQNGGSIAGNARLELEKKSGRPVIARQNYLSSVKRNKRKDRLE